MKFTIKLNVLEKETSWTEHNCECRVFWSDKHMLYEWEVRHTRHHITVGGFHSDAAVALNHAREHARMWGKRA